MSRGLTILIADDDYEDRMLAQRALRQARLTNDLQFVEDGEALIAYLTRATDRQPPADAPRPGLILLDLNMPRMDGREALRLIKQNPAWKDIPVVVLTTSKAEEDIYRSYQLGVNSFITKPVTFDGLVAAMSMLGRYWFELVELPEPPK